MPTAKDRGMCPAWFSSPVTAQKALGSYRNIQNARPHRPESRGLSMLSDVVERECTSQHSATLPYATRTEPCKSYSQDVHVGHPPLPRVVMGTHFMFYVVLLCLVQMHLDQPTAVQLHTDPLAHDLAGEHQVFQDGVVHGGQGTAVRGQGTLMTDRGTSTARVSNGRRRGEGTG